MPTQPLSERVIRRLYEITNDYHKGFDYQILELLQMGLDRFKLDIAILSKIEDNDYFIQYCVTPDDVVMEPGDQFELDSTYCEITCSAKGPVAIEYVGNDENLSKHPAYRALKLESYIGIPIFLKGKIYGTLNFSSATPYYRKFLDIDIDTLQLMASWVEVELIRREQEHELKVLNEKLKHLAHYDSLTNVLNRRGIYKVLKKDFNEVSSLKSEGCLAMVDIDHFKKLNDSFGHQKGDKALVEVSQKIAESLGDNDSVARLGGEEFLLWIPNANLESCKVVCDRVMKNIENISVVPSTITVSIGVCHFRFNDEQQDDLTKIIETLIAKADGALYEAKSQGRNCLINCDETILY